MRFNDLIDPVNSATVVEENHLNQPIFLQLDLGLSFQSQDRHLRHAEAVDLSSTHESL